MGLLAVLFAYMAKYRDLRFGLKLSFLVIFIFLALRYNFGNDYIGYFDLFVNINKVIFFDNFDKASHVEPGWIFLCKLFKPIGFFGMVAVLALFNCLIYYRFIKKFVPIKYYWLAVFLYVFDPHFLLIHASAQRQSVAIGIFLLSVDYIYKRDLLRFLLCVFAAWLVHSSALIILPIYFLGVFNWTISSTAKATLLFIFAALFVFASSFILYINQFISVYFTQYEIYQDAAYVGSGLGLIFFAVFYYLTIEYEKYQIKEIALLFKIAIVSFIFIPLSLLIQLISRMGMYFQIVIIVTYPNMYLNLKKRAQRYLFISSLMVMTIYSFVAFFRSETFKNAYGNYQTIFSYRKL